ncbi:DUF4286 family protein [Sphingomonas immobilis]|uniref:EthD domain-containing protein n=1 Tax=Sphingomonas immobilis TaxID=3063997 RepID=A0ABT8ZX93_9SPHN|nr:DUF4286 family protein [Sphingomonas sp. CA1-15]MDO7842189.1 hypothetical protein [Sphingomonas sp. CA1-15]
MAEYKFVVFSKPAEGREDEYNRWYDERHVPDVVAIPGFTGAKRYRRVPAEGEQPAWNYLAIYDIESDDVSAAMAALMTRAGTDAMPISEALGGAETHLFEAIPAVETVS